MYPCPPEPDPIAAVRGDTRAAAPQPAPEHAAPAANASATPITVKTKPARGETWPRVEQFLEFTGDPQRVCDIAAAVGATDTAVINALQRNGAVQEPGTGRWTLAKYLAPAAQRNGATVLDGAAA